MQSWSEAVILAADGLSALDKERTDHSSISDKGKVSSFSTFCYLCHPLSLCIWPSITSDRGSSQQINSKNQIQMKHAAGNIYHLQMCYHAKCVYLHPPFSKRRRVGIHLSCS